MSVCMVGSVCYCQRSVSLTNDLHMSQQKEDDRGMARLNAPLKKLLQCGEEQVRIASMDGRISHLLLPLDPLRFDYTLKCG